MNELYISTLFLAFLNEDYIFFILYCLSVILAIIFVSLSIKTQFIDDKGKMYSQSIGEIALKRKHVAPFVKRERIRRIIGGLWLLVIGVLAGLFIDRTHKNYADNRSGLVPIVTESPIIESGGVSDNESLSCHDHSADVCVSASDESHELVPDSAKFIVLEKSQEGKYLNGLPENNNPVGTNNLGWYIRPDKTNNRQVCVTVFARTSACENKVFIKGKLSVDERRK